MELCVHDIVSSQPDRPSLRSAVRGDLFPRQRCALQLQGTCSRAPVQRFAHLYWTVFIGQSPTLKLQSYCHKYLMEDFQLILRRNFLDLLDGRRPYYNGVVSS